MFKKYHYLSQNISNSSKNYCVEINKRPVAFCSVIHFPHPKVKNLKKMHRIVVLPEYQSLGISHHLLNYIGEIYYKQKFRLSITTGLKTFMLSLKKNKNWVLTRYGRVSLGSDTGLYHNKKIKGSTSSNRITATFEYKSMD